MSDTRPVAAEIGAFREVRATFTDSAALQQAIVALETHGFDRADLSLPETNPPPLHNTPDAGARVAYTDSDARQARALHTSTAASIGAMAAAGAVVATGGAAIPAVAAAVAAGGLLGGATFAATTAADNAEQTERDRQAATGTLILSVRTTTPDRHAKAAEVLRAAGGQVERDR